MQAGNWIRYWVDVNPNQEVIVFQEKRITYSEFNQNINRTANALLANGVKPGDRVACLLLNCPEFLEIVAACQKIGARFVPVNTRLVSRDLEFIMNDCEPIILFTESKFNSVVDTIREKISVKQIVYVGGDPKGVSYVEWSALANEDEPVVDLGEDTDFGILYTSGTTGTPKGVVLSQSNIFYMALQIGNLMSYSTEDRHTVGLPLCFTGSLVCHALPILFTGGTLIMEQDYHVEKWLELIERERITRILAVPTVLSVMSEHSNFKTTDFSNIRSVQSGGANVPETIVNLFQYMGIDVILGYGSTEIGGMSSFVKISKNEKKPIAYLPLMLNKHRIVSEDGRVCDIGVVGEICTKSPTVMREYWNNPGATNEALMDGWLHTGDLGKVDSEGNMYIVDRKKDMVITGGINVYPAEVEQVIYQCKEVLHATVIGLPHPKWGEAVVGFVVAKPGQKVSAEDVKAYCRENLAHYKAPLDVFVVNELPVNGFGKVVKNVLSEQFKGYYSELSRS